MSISVPRTFADVEVSFSWSPQQTTQINYSNGAMVTAASAKTNTTLTFTASTRTMDNGDIIPTSLTLVEYRWDFGDGVVGFGATTTHRYIIPNYNCQCLLTITDSRGNLWKAVRPMYLTT